MGIGKEIMDSVRDGVNDAIDEHAVMIGIEKTTEALKDASIDDEQIVVLLQKHWDLRPSEARKFL